MRPLTSLRENSVSLEAVLMRTCAGMSGSCKLSAVEAFALSSQHPTARIFTIHQHMYGKSAFAAIHSRSACVC